MNRGASAAVQAEVAKRANAPFHLFELYLDGATTYATDAFRTIEWNGNPYPAAGHFIGFDGVEETNDLSVSQARVSLSGVDQTEIAAILQHAYIDRRLVIRKAFFDASSGVIVDPFPLFEGRCDAPVIVEDPDVGSVTVTITAASHWVDFERKPGRHTNDAEQQIWFPGDKGFEFISQLNKQIKWGTV